MKPYSVCWLEGAFMTPQHFQQQERFLTHFTSQYYGLLNPSRFGFATLDIDSVLLSAGKFGITGAAGIFPDHSPFIIDELLVISIPENTCDAIVYLTLPIHRYGTAEVSESPSTRYQYYAEDIIDSINPQSPVARVEMARPSLELMISDDDSAGYTRIQVARITHIDNDGAVHLDNRFIPSALNLRTSRFVLDKLEELSGRISQKTRTIASRLRSGRHFKSEQSLWQDQLWSVILGQWKARLGVLMTQPFLCPFILYKELFVMIGSLGGLSEETPPEPLNLHPDALTQIMPEVFNFLLSALDLASRESVIELSLDDSRFISKRILSAMLPLQVNHTHRCILSVSAPEDAAWLMENIPRFVTLAPETQIDELLRTAMPGLELSPLTMPPVELSLPDCQTFVVDTLSQAWKQMLQENGRLNVHLDRQLGEPEIRLFLIQQT
ncbi:MAG: type VI secretion system baseplate subunit TssK [Endozoicomonas sp.]